jgi:hypothetical protein
MISAKGRTSGSPGGGQSSSRILEQDADRMLVEFNTPLKIGPISTTWKTTEWVTPNAPSSIDFNLVPVGGIMSGGLRELVDRFEFEQQGNCTLLTYKSRFGIRWSVGGWLLDKVLFGPIIKSHMIEHLGEVKEMIESRAKNSHIYPQLDCEEVGS